LQQTGPGNGVRAMVGDSKWKDYTLSLKARKLGGAEGFLILFNMRDDGAKSWWNLGGWGNHRHALETDGAVDGGVEGRIETGRWYDIRIEVQGARIRCFLDGHLVHDVSSTTKSVFAVASRATSGDVILKVVNADAEAHAAEIELSGLGGNVKSATATVLTSARDDDENTLDEPTKVVPVTSPVPAAAAMFGHTFPARSVTVLQVNVAK